MEKLACVFALSLSIDLFECFKDSFEFVGGNVDAGMFDMNPPIIIRLSTVNCDLAAMGEFDGIANQIEEHLKYAPLRSILNLS